MMKNLIRTFLLEIKQALNKLSFSICQRITVVLVLYKISSSALLFTLYTTALHKEI